MKNKVIKKVTMLVICLLLLAPSIQATITISKEEFSEPIQAITNIRKQFMHLSETGYFNHVQSKSNQEPIQLTNVYINQIAAIRQSLEEYKSLDLDKFSAMKIKTLLAVTLYLKEMSENLIDYLSASTLKDQYDFYNIHLQLNEFIIGILADIENAEY